LCQHAQPPEEPCRFFDALVQTGLQPHQTALDITLTPLLFIYKKYFGTISAIHY